MQLCSRIFSSYPYINISGNLTGTVGPVYGTGFALWAGRAFGAGDALFTLWSLFTRLSLRALGSNLTLRTLGAGNTTLACRLITEFSKLFPVTAIKISPHFHESTPQLPEIASYEGFVIYEEILHDTGKDSSRFLDAGAKRVCLVLK